MLLFTASLHSRSVTMNKCKLAVNFALQTTTTQMALFGANQVITKELLHCVCMMFHTYVECFSSCRQGHPLEYFQNETNAVSISWNHLWAYAYPSSPFVLSRGIQINTNRHSVAGRYHLNYHSFPCYSRHYKRLGSQESSKSPTFTYGDYPEVSPEERCFSISCPMHH